MKNINIYFSLTETPTIVLHARKIQVWGTLSQQLLFTFCVIQSTKINEDPLTLSNMSINY